MSVAQTSAPPTADVLIARARALVPQVAACAREAREARRVPERIIAEIAEAGLFRILQPAGWGGYEMKPETFYEVLIALAEGDMSVGWVYGVLGVHPWLMGLMDQRAVSDVWGNDDSVRLCSSLMPVGKAQKVDGGFRLSGHWRFSSGCHYAQWALLGGIVQSDGAQAGGPPDVRLFLVPQTEYRVDEVWRVSGLCATGSEDILVDDVFVPDYRTRRMIDNLNCVGPGQAVNTSPLYRIPFGQVFFRGVSSPAIGALQAMLDAFVAYAGKRSGPAGKSVDDPVAQQICAEVTAAIDEMKLVLRRNMSVLWEYGARAEVPPMRLRQQFKFQSASVSHRCAELATRLMRATGAAGIYDEQPFGRTLADITAARQHIANQFEMVGRNWGVSILGGKPANDMML
jgi:3-hydroxy-9,10-secoandrosta-1,3,5(10)-triene-9,17-dione monooxygenase